ncbi:hypothetical protein QJS10_CPB19g01855 [Acorus calamus]|uniref:Photosystem II PsbX n=1 Tax=Acorus calamus TaxID=4465 RepID=A0AAV9CH84_ACOCL|nr:hypothetical protein QJS10_CPB19g01855 [Acorus calamus]
MASTSAISAMPMASAAAQTKPMAGSFFQPLKLAPAKASIHHAKAGRASLKVCASMKEKAVTGLTAVALTAAMVLPDIAEAAQPGVSPSLKNFLFSIVAGGVVLTVIVGAVVGVSNFDPVKRT